MNLFSLSAKIRICDVLLHILHSSLFYITNSVDSLRSFIVQSNMIMKILTQYWTTYKLATNFKEHNLLKKVCGDLFSIWKWNLSVIYLIVRKTVNSPQCSCIFRSKRYRSAWFDMIEIWQCNLAVCWGNVIYHSCDADSCLLNLGRIKGIFFHLNWPIPD